MDFLFFTLCTAVLVALAFAGSSSTRVVSGIGLIVLGAVAMGEGVQVTYYLADNGSVVNVTHSLAGDSHSVLLPITYVFGGIAVLVSSMGEIRRGGGGSGGFVFAD